MPTRHLPLIDTAPGMSRFRKRLLAWYRIHHRDLPWRKTSDPYAVWISEIMLQQTQVATVIDYYERFLQRFPDVQHLAAANEQEVLTYWSGLGYYRRARQLHAASKQIVEQNDGKFPTAFDDVLALPGIGRYTAGAIVSFAYGTRAPILEANTIRLFSRLMGLREDPKRSAAQAQLWQFAERILPQRGPAISQINQATMELGSLLCLPKQPKCHCCPLSTLCSANLNGLQAEIPLPSAAKVFSHIHHALVIVQSGGKTLLRQNPSDGWWAGLWDFPRVELSECDSDDTFDASIPNQSRQSAIVERAIQSKLLLNCRTTRFVKTVRHAVTRYRIALHCFEARLNDDTPLPDAEIWRWVDLRQVNALPLTSTAEQLRVWLTQVPSR